VAVVALGESRPGRCQTSTTGTRAQPLTGGLANRGFIRWEQPVSAGQELGDRDAQLHESESPSGAHVGA
jgi:hypothetical protein